MARLFGDWLDRHGLVPVRRAAVRSAGALGRAWGRVRPLAGRLGASEWVTRMAVGAAGFFLFLAAGLVAAGAPVSPGSGDRTVFTVEPGQGAGEIAAGLERSGLIRDRFEFRALCVLFGWEDDLRTGRYELSPGYSAWRILRKIRRGEVITVSVTIPEGYTFEQIERLLEERGLTEPGAFRQALDELASRGDIPFLPLDRSKFIEPYEGLLFPDTYYFEESAGAEVIARTLTRRTGEAFSGELLERAAELGLEPFEVLTLASIIEKEAMVEEERALISSVYHNRLRIGMKLDACPTVRYVLKKPPSQPLLYADLDVASPYNTYRNAGLPPGPICSPGRASILAA
ncbi:MAG: endolytic transglycosylase MltG, partial [Firmicutes bacterium]|nr:endolytic transglycosylase MltG [Bacillota bacterium]